jgi:RecJ-like exonuclease
MDEKQLFNIAMLSSIIGLIGLSTVSYVYEYKLTAIGDIDESYIDKKVLVEGVISELRSNKGVYSFTVTDETGSIKGVIFSEKLNVKNIQNARATGSITSYNKELEINVERLERI